MVNNAPYYIAFSESFKGLPDGWHRLKKINFLVGENSTGKSSFQQLFRIVSHHSFVFSFNALGIIPTINSPHDFISRLADEPVATIGFASVDTSEDDGKGRDFYGRLVTYIDDKGDLEVAVVTFATPSSVFTLFRKDKKIALVWHGTVDQLDLIQNPERLEDIHKNSISNEHPEFLNIDESEVDILDWRDFAYMAARSHSEEGTYSSPVMTPQRFQALSYGPARRAPQRLVHGDNSKFNSTGVHIPYMFKNIVQYIPDMEKRLIDFGLASGLFESVSIDQIETKTGDNPFVITVQKSGKFFYIDELGYGVSQILPVAVDILVASNNNTLLIQQPELHLHPRAQAEFGEFVHRNASDGPSMIIETHSDFIIDRFRVSQALSEKSEKVSAQVLFFEIDAETGHNKISPMEINESGHYTEIPDGYREFFIDENMKILEAL